MKIGKNITLEALVYFQSLSRVKIGIQYTIS